MPSSRAGKMEPSFPLGTTRRVPQENFSRKPYNKFVIDQVCSDKMAGYWLILIIVSLWTSTATRSIDKQKEKKNSATVLSSCPHTWSITHIYFLNHKYV